MKLTDFSVLTFDCYGTLIDWETGILEALRPWAGRCGCGASDDALLEAFARHETARQSERPGALYPEILALTMADIASELGLTTAPGETAAFGNSVKDWPAFADSRDALAYLKRHYKLVILSNVDRASFAASNRKLDIAFDLVVTAQDVGSYKPAPAHFETALSRLAALGIPQDKVLHTAQSLYHDHVPAKAQGLATLWVNRRAGRPGGGATATPQSPVTPDWEVPSLAAMVDLHRAQLAA